MPIRIETVETTSKTEQNDDHEGLQIVDSAALDVNGKHGTAPCAVMSDANQAE